MHSDICMMSAASGGAFLKLSPQCLMIQFDCPIGRTVRVLCETFRMSNFSHMEVDTS